MNKTKTKLFKKIQVFLLVLSLFQSHYAAIASSMVIKDELVESTLKDKNLTFEKYEKPVIQDELTKFLDYLTASPVGREYFDLTAKKTTNLASTNSTTILQFSVPIPPLAEQERIIAILDRNTSTINEIIAEKETLVSDLESYKKSLIYEVVTGKRRVC